VNRIRVLSDEVANQIAAGEVIERPASVVKELVENAIDAGATRIQVEVRGGGKSVIRVSDNGHGMGRDDAMLCLERHATSKIRNSADITAIATLGFRGEAIPSIASVSRFRLLTREADSTEGTEIDIHGGKLLAVREAGCAVGAQVEVRNLFYNLPARRKFLRSDATELGHIHHVFLLHALARPAIAWALHQDERTVHDLATATANPEDALAALKQRVRALYGPQLADHLTPVDFSREGISLRGLIGKAGLSRSNRSEMYCFVNGRPVDSRAIYYGLLEGYHSALMRGRYPVCFLFLEIDAGRVDVNIHPAKREVRFREDALVQGTIVEAVRRALGKSPDVSSPPSAISRQPSAVSVQPLTISGQQSAAAQPSAIAAQRSPPSTPATQPSFFSNSQSPVRPSTGSGPSLRFGNPQSAIRNQHSLQVLGILSNLYVIAADADGLLIIDQHAAHERVLFERMLKRASEGAVASQRLLLPQTVELSPRDAAELRQRLPLLERMGFGIAEFGDRSFIVDALPSWLAPQGIDQLLRTMLDEIEQAGREINRERFAEELIARTVCRHAVKANDILHPEEIQNILSELQSCENPSTCPHGRPTMIRFSHGDLERRFGRRDMGSGER
jgi:DNA mismatch repair protein MutL